MDKRALIIMSISILGGCTDAHQATRMDTLCIEVEKRVCVTWDDFIDAVIYVESRGNDSAHNIKEDAVGCLQIRPIMVTEVNRRLAIDGFERRYSLDDRWSRAKSIEMFNYMATKVSTNGRTFMGYCEVVARRWNGGYNGDKMCTTKNYWSKIKRQINE